MDADDESVPTLEGYILPWETQFRYLRTDFFTSMLHANFGGLAFIPNSFVDFVLVSKSYA